MDGDVMTAGAIAGAVAALIFLGISAQAGTLSEDQAERFDRDQDGQVDTGMAVVYARHLYDRSNILAEYDADLDGEIGLEELARLNADLRAVDPRSAEIRLREREGVPIPLMTSPASLDAAVSKDVGQFYLREKRIEIGVDSEEPGDAVTSGAAITSTTDLDGNRTLVSVSAALGYLYRRNLDFPEGYEPGDVALTAISFGPYLEMKGNFNSEDSRVVLGGIAQAEVLGGPFDLQRLSLAPYYQTDLTGRSSIYGAVASWQPYVLDWALGSIRRLPGEVLDVTWSVTAEGDYRFIDTGVRTDLTQDDYAWVGVDATVRVWPFPEILDSRVFADANYTFHQDLLSGDRASHFTAGVGVNLIASGAATANLEYFVGDDYKTGEDEEIIKTSLKVKY